METGHGLCKCGCGEVTKKATRNISRQGVLKGEHINYCHGHNGRKANLSSESIRARCEVEPMSGCWIWMGTVSAQGYGMMKGHVSDGVGRISVHRTTYEATFGAIPDGHSVLHRCDNTLCCNPSHLFTGTQADNMRDKVRKGRQPRGEAVTQSKLTWQDVIQIRESQAKPTELAQIFGVCRRYICSIQNNKARGQA